MFKNMKLSAKLIGGFAIVLIIFTGVMGIYQYTVKSTTGGFEKLMQEEIAIAYHAAQSGAFMLQSRRNEKDFLIRLDKKYVGKLEKNVAGLKKEAQSIIELAGQMGDEESASKASKIISYAEEYKTTFNALVASWEIRGLDHKSGLQGKFRNIVHDFAEDMQEHQVDDLLVVLLHVTSMYFTQGISL